LSAIGEAFVAADVADDDVASVLHGTLAR
jgi:hypothetical protein